MLRRISFLIAAIVVPGAADLLRIETERSEVIQHESFSGVGAYERIVGKAFFELDPRLHAPIK
jgi:hypothetical protein